jgi:CRP-like cAMP-binding protein
MPMKLIAQQAEILPNTNRLLAALPRADYQRMLPNLQRVRLNFGEILYSPGDKVQHIYFPDDAHVSLLTPVDHHHAFEIGLVGYEGMVGIGVALGVKESAVLALVQGRGTAMRMTAARFRHEFKLSLSLQRGVHLYVHALLAQVAQTAACKRFHSIEARLARWLLMTRDRVCSNQFHMTHEFLGHMLGVRRVGVTKGARALKIGKLRL